MKTAKLLTDAELRDLAERSLDLIADMRAASESIRKSIGIGDDVATPLRYAQTFSALGRDASDLANAMLTVAAHAEERAILAETLSARAKDAQP